MDNATKVLAMDNDDWLFSYIQLTIYNSGYIGRRSKPLGATHKHTKFHMEAAISAIASDLTSRFMSFLIKKYTVTTVKDDKIKRMNELLLRVHAVVEEADGRCITNPKMLTQFKMLAEIMYRGYYILDKINYKPPNDKEVRRLSIMSVSLKRSRTILGTPRNCTE